MNKIIIVILVALSLSACGLKTTVVLMKDDDGQVGKVEVKAPAATRTLKEAQEYTVATDTVAPVAVMDEKTIQKYFAGALAAEPEKVISFLIFFLSDSAEMTADSKKEFYKIVEAIKARKHTAISVIGHTDTTGSDEVNMKLSLARADAVIKILQDQGIPQTFITRQYFGKNDLLVPTADQVPEAKNRRVEIFVR
ncbi:MAG: OmpA family protein [Thermodesulfobacteriota bacterium]